MFTLKRRSSRFTPGVAVLEDRALLSRGGSWAAVAPLPTARVYLGSTTGNDGTIYAIGGFQQGDVPSAEVDAYNGHTNSWTQMAPLPTARGALAVVSGNHGTIYAIGGSRGGTSSFSEVDAYNPRTNIWTTVAPLPTPRGDLAAAVGNNGIVYAIGGNVAGTDGTTATTEVDAYNPRTKGAIAPVPRFSGRFPGFSPTTRPESAVSREGSLERRGASPVK